MSAAIKAASLGLVTTAACTLFNLAPYPAAAVFASTGVAAAGANRAITGECWGACVGGLCDRDSGVCIARPCGGECRYDEVCKDGQCILRRREEPPVANDDAGEPSSDEMGERDD